MNKQPKKYTLLWITIIAGLVCGITAGIFMGLTRDLPQIQALNDFKPSAVTRVYSSDHILMTEFFLERRDPVPLKQIPPAYNSLVNHRRSWFLQAQRHCGEGNHACHTEKFPQRPFCPRGQHLDPAIGKNALFKSPQNNCSQIAGSYFGAAVGTPLYKR
jgi:hypothetical protein